MKKKTLLITSVGSLSGRSLLMVLSGFRDRLRIVGTNSDPTSPTIYDCDAAYLTPLTADTEAFEAALRDIITREQPDIILNGRDEEVGSLARLAAEGIGAAYAGPTVQQAPIFGDKYETAVFARSNGLPFAETAFTQEEADALIEQCGFPVVAKPRWNGFASRDVFLLNTPEQVEQAVARGDMVLQEFIDPSTVSDSLETWRSRLGIPLSWALKETRLAVEMVIGPDGEVASICTVEGDTSGPLTQNMTVLDDPEMERVARNYAKVLVAGGMRGPLNMQGKRHPVTGFKPFELNSRFTGCSEARTMLGHNQVEQMVSLCLPELQGSGFADTGVLIRRVAIYRDIHREDLERLTKTRYWSADD